LIKEWKDRKRVKLMRHDRRSRFHDGVEWTRSVAGRDNPALLGLRFRNR